MVCLLKLHYLLRAQVPFHHSIHCATANPNFVLGDGIGNLLYDIIRWELRTWIPSRVSNPCLSTRACSPERLNNSLNCPMGLAVPYSRVRNHRGRSPAHLDLFLDAAECQLSIALGCQHMVPHLLQTLEQPLEPVIRSRPFLRGHKRKQDVCPRVRKAGRHKR